MYLIDFIKGILKFKKIFNKQLNTISRVFLLLLVQNNYYFILLLNHDFTLTLIS